MRTLEGEGPLVGRGIYQELSIDLDFGYVKYRNGETVTLVYENAMFVCLGEMFDELILTGDYCVVTNKDL